MICGWLALLFLGFGEAEYERRKAQERKAIYPPAARKFMRVHRRNQGKTHPVRETFQYPSNSFSCELVNELIL